MTPILETPRLRLSAPARADIEAMARLANDFELASAMARIPHPYTQDDAAEFIESLGADDLQWAIRERAGQVAAFIGMIGMHELGAGPELFYWLGRPFQGRGFASEAVGRVIVHVFDALGRSSIAATYYDGNEGSRRVLEKAGFTPVGRSSCHCLARGASFSQTDMRLDAEDWRKRLAQVKGANQSSLPESRHSLSGR